jgi:hypothetical protein
VAVGVGVAEGAGVGVRVGSGDGVGVGLGRGVIVGVADGLVAALGEGEGVGAFVGEALGEGVALDLALGLGIGTLWGTCGKMTPFELDPAPPLQPTKPRSVTTSRKPVTETALFRTMYPPPSGIAHALKPW